MCFLLLPSRQPILYKAVRWISLLIELKKIEEKKASTLYYHEVLVKGISLAL
jgi:hypothetical protein